METLVSHLHLAEAHTLTPVTLRMLQEAVGTLVAEALKKRSSKS